ncbi:MAG: hypothetical protein Q7U57_14710 [Methylovulum sp.]|nr:hypothetical protein [Methylovulum sp.]
MLKKLALTLLAILVIFEEWLWDILTLVGQWLARALALERFDERLAQASPPLALLAFFIPLAVVTPLNLFALFLLTHGAIVEGILLEIVAKLTGTLLIARIFKLVRPALLTFAWFARFYGAVMRLLQWAHRLVHDSAIYKLSVVVKMAVKTKIQQFRQYCHR